MSALHTPANVVADATDLVRWIELDQLDESGWNPRQYYPEAAMAELVESMRESGFRPWLPLLVRPRGEDRYEIGAGHRRSRAAREAGLTQVPCIVQDLSDEEFLDVLNFDNTGREDVHPLHEAAGWRNWMERTGKGVLDIAARIGQSKEYVYQRLKYSALIEPAARAFLDGQITSAHAILIARLEAKAQEKALKFAIAADWQGNRPSVRKLSDHLHMEAYVDLRRDCPFERNDHSLLAGAGACGECPKRAANIAGFEFDPEDPEPDLCTDRSCHAQKTTNHLVRIKDQLKSTAGEVIEVTDSWSTKRKGVLVNSQYEVVTASEGKRDASVKTALVVDGSAVGSVITVRVKPAPKAEKQPARPSEAEREQQRLEAEAKEAEELAIRRAILRAVYEKISTVTRADAQAVLLDAYIDHDCAEELCLVAGVAFEKWRERDALKAALPKMKDVEVLRLLVCSAVITTFDSYALERPADALLALAKRYKVDALKIRAERAGGTRREAIAKLPALNERSGKSAPVKKAAKAKKAPAKKPVKKGGKK